MRAIVRRRSSTAALVLLALVATLACRPDAAHAQERVLITGDRLSGFVLPTEPQRGDIILDALRVNTWTVDDTKRLVLDGDVRVRIADMLLTADRAVVWLNRIPSADGVINQIAVYFDSLSEPTNEAGVGVKGRRVLVTASARGGVRLNAGLVRERVARGGFVGEGEERLAAHLRRIAAGLESLQRFPRVVKPERRPEPVPTPGGSPQLEEVDLPETVELPLAGPDLPIVTPQGLVRFSFGGAEYRPGEDEDVVIADGGVIVDYQSQVSGAYSQITMSAERAVVFVDPGSVDGTQSQSVSAARIRGVYLEGAVIVTTNRDEYTVRAPRVFYDYRNDRAIMPDAVLRTYDDRLNKPIYARAKRFRQVAANQWEGEGVRVSASEFRTPHLAIGAKRVTVTQLPEDDGPGVRTRVDSDSNTLRIGDLPILYWPNFEGDIEAIPLRSVSAGYSDSEGVGVETRWNLPALIGLAQPQGADLELAVDGYSERGVGVGVTGRYRGQNGQGVAELYGLYDTGDDRTSSGQDVERDDGFRGVALWEHRMKLAPRWDLQAQFSYISDETFITTWREDDFEDRREYETSLYLKYQKRNTAFTFLAKGELNDFVSNEYLLASRTYQVERLPEIGYYRFGDSLFDDTMTYSSESRLGLVRLDLTKATPRELGVRPNAFGPGVNADDRLDEVLIGRGYPTQIVQRFDTRHEVSRPFQYGWARITPFGVARLTAYDEDFEDFSEDADSTRVWGALGVTASTEISRINDGAQSRVFNIDRLRHIIEPRLSIWWADTTVDDDDLPVYDEEVESIASGAAVEAGMRHTWQTMRGGAGRQRSVDFLIWDAAVVMNSGDAGAESDNPQYFGYRPEYSLVGDHFRNQLRWALSDFAALTSDVTLDLDDGEMARGSIGMRFDHSPAMWTLIEYRDLDVTGDQLLVLGANYQLTPKYSVTFRPQWDFNNDEFREILFQVTREFPDIRVRGGVRFDQIRDETSFFASLAQTTF